MKTKTKYKCMRPDQEVLIGNEESMNRNEDGSMLPLKAFLMNGGSKCIRDDDDCSSCEHGQSYLVHMFPNQYVDGKESYDAPRDSREFFEDAKEQFHVGISGMDEVPVDVQQCNKCGGTHFNIGFGNWSLVYRCVQCQWEKVENIG